MKKFISKKIFALLIFCAQPLAAEPLFLTISADGKGTALGWDVGVLKALHERADKDQLKDAKFAFVGSSSGSLMATYLACNGFNQRSMEYLEKNSQALSKDFLNEDTNMKTFQLFFGLPTEVSFDGANTIIDFVTNKKTCVPTYPFMVVASNNELVDGRIPEQLVDRPLKGKDDRVFVRETYDVLEYVKEKDKTITVPIGKACTYFLNGSMAELIETIPAKERLCDLRLIKTAEDLVIAIMASIAEPTYFPVVKETAMASIRSIYAINKDRFYGGGWVMNSVVQEIARAIGGVIFGTGRATYDRLQEAILREWFYEFPLNETLLDQWSWFSGRVPVTRKVWDKLYEKQTTIKDLVKLGYDATISCLDKNQCATDVSTKPFYAKPAKGNGPKKDLSLLLKQ